MMRFCVRLPDAAKRYLMLVIPLAIAFSLVARNAMEQA